MYVYKPMDAQMREFFGHAELQIRFKTLNPTIQQRKNEFDFLWFYFGEKAEITIDFKLLGGGSEEDLLDTLQKEFGVWNVLNRFNKFRFRDSESLMCCKLRHYNF